VEEGNLVFSYSIWDDILVLCKVNLQGLQASKTLFTIYVLALGHIINSRKSTLYVGAISNSKTFQINNLRNFNIGNRPFIYLEVPIFKGKPKVVRRQGAADKVKNKLALWKASLLSIAGRVHMVKYPFRR